MGQSVEVVVSELHSAAARLEGTAQRLQDGLSSVNDETAQLLGSGWQGGAASAYGPAWDKWHDGAQQVVQGLQRMSELLTIAGKEYAKTDESASGALDSTVAGAGGAGGGGTGGSGGGSGGGAGASGGEMAGPSADRNPAGNAAAGDASDAGGGAGADQATGSSATQLSQLAAQPLSQVGQAAAGMAQALAGIAQQATQIATEAAQQADTQRDEPSPADGEGDGRAPEEPAASSDAGPAETAPADTSAAVNRNDPSTGPAVRRG